MLSWQNIRCSTKPFLLKYMIAEMATSFNVIMWFALFYDVQFLCTRRERTRSISANQRKENFRNQQNAARVLIRARRNFSGEHSKKKVSGNLVG